VFKATKLIGPELTNPEVYDLVMPERIEQFMNGYSVNVLAFGQTGSGKTYTMISQHGSMKANPELNPESIPGEFGLFMRSVC
jgi:Tfp pilus assembly pilus retraction ATPase PilT